MKQNIQKLGNLLKTSQKILLINHIRMDGDAFGSLIAFYKILKKLGKTVKATNDEKSPENFNFLGNQNTIVPNINIKDFNPDLIIAFDAGSEEQLGEIYKENRQYIQNKSFVVIDHHITNKGFGKLNIISFKASSTCEIIFEILKELNLEKYIDNNIATLLITGIITDTNIYYNSNTTHRTLEIASKLVSFGADYRLSIFHFFRKREINKSKLWGEILKDIKSDNNGKIVWAIVKKEYFKKTGTTKKDITGLINEFLANIEGSKVCFLLYPLNNSNIKVSFRSNEINVGEIASNFGGGGHKQAAGFTSSKDIKTIEKEILITLKKVLN